MWGVYEAFEAELAALAQEEWLTFRSRAFRFEDFVRGWLGRLPPSGRTHVSRPARGGKPEQLQMLIL